MNTYTLTEATRQRLMEIADMNADHESFALLNAAPSTIGFNGLTEAETDESMSVRGLSQKATTSTSPVAEFVADDDCGYVQLLAHEGEPLTDGQKLFAAPLAAPSTNTVPLTSEQAIDAYLDTPPFGTYMGAFIAGIRFIEAKIKGGA